MKGFRAFYQIPKCNIQNPETCQDIWEIGVPPMLKDRREPVPTRWCIVKCA